MKKIICLLITVLLSSLTFAQKDRFYFGLSLPQIYQAPIKLYEGAGKNSKIVNHFNLNGAYKFDLGDDFKIEPSFLVKYEIPTPPKIDVGMRVIYQEQIWLGGAYRHNDAFTALIGYFYKNYLITCLHNNEEIIIKDSSIYEFIETENYTKRSN